MNAICARIALYDDVHAEFERTADGARRPDAWLPPPMLDVDAILFAGDIESNAQRFRTFIGHVRVTQRPETEIVVIPGNHEGYGNNLVTQADEFRAAIADIPDTHYLERSSVTLASGLRVVGATLWTDLSSPEHELNAWRMNDYHKISYDDRRLLPEDTTKIHRDTLAWLTRELQTGDRARTIVMTHHAPSTLSNWTAVGEQNPLPYRSPEIEPMYCNNLDDMLIEKGPALWVHGHLHRSVDYQVGDTRVMSNPRGYWDRDPREDEQSPGFCDRFIVQIDVDQDNRVTIATDHGMTRREAERAQRELALAQGVDR